MCVQSMSISEVSISEALDPIWRCFGASLVQTADGKIAPARDQPPEIGNIMQETWCKIFYGYLYNTYADAYSIQEWHEHDVVVRVGKDDIIVSFAFNTNDEIETVLIRGDVIDEDTVETHFNVLDALEYLTELQTELDREHGGDTTPTAATVVSPTPRKGIPTQSTETAVALSKDHSVDIEDDLPLSIPLTKGDTAHPHMGTPATPWTYIRNC
jgi:hypothetical protein